MQVTAEGVSMITKEGHKIDCYRDKKLLINSLRTMVCRFETC